MRTLTSPIFSMSLLYDTVMRWVAVARVLENSDLYATAFREIFNLYQLDNKDFKVANLKGIALDWSDTKRKGLELAIGKNVAQRLMIGCLVHYGRSYQRVADRISASLPMDIRKLSKD